MKRWFIPALAEENDRIDGQKKNFHCRERLEIFYCKSGSVDIDWLSGGQTRNLSITAGDIAVVQAGVTHRLSIGDNAAFWALELIEAPLTDAHGKFLHLLESPHYRALMNQSVTRVNDDNNALYLLTDIRDELERRNGEMSDVYLDCMLYAFLSKLVRSYVGATTAESGKKTLTKAVNFVNLEYMRPISVLDIAAAAEVSPQYLRKLFIDAFGLNVIQYLTATRVKKCVYYLTQTDLGMNEIARAVGFGSIQSMDKNFKNLIGLTPMGYKQASPARRAALNFRF